MNSATSGQGTWRAAAYESAIVSYVARTEVREGGTTSAERG